MAVMRNATAGSLFLAVEMLATQQAVPTIPNCAVIPSNPPDRRVLRFGAIAQDRRISPFGVSSTKLTIKDLAEKQKIQLAWESKKPPRSRWLAAQDSVVFMRF
jgi:hypothetical protein